MYQGYGKILQDATLQLYAFQLQEDIGNLLFSDPARQMVNATCVEQAAL
jgi:hypothetical protein